MHGVYGKMAEGGLSDFRAVCACSIHGHREDRPMGSGPDHTKCVGRRTVVEPVLRNEPNREVRRSEPTEGYGRIGGAGLSDSRAVSASFIHVRARNAWRRSQCGLDATSPVAEGIKHHERGGTDRVVLRDRWRPVGCNLESGADCETRDFLKTAVFGGCRADNSVVNRIRDDGATVFAKNRGKPYC
jgi:hypothetical protein